MPIGAPPPAAGATPIPTEDNGRKLTVRERIAKVTEPASCQGCHKAINGIGFGLGRFDQIGRFTETELGKPIDASGALHTGETFENEQGFLQALAKSADLPRCYSEQWSKFAFGSDDVKKNKCFTESITKRLAAANLSTKEAIRAIATSPTYYRD